MNQYDPKDSAIGLKDPDGNDGSFFDNEGNFKSEEVHERVSETVDLVVNQARQPCVCTEGEKKRKGKLASGEVDVCLPCEARGAINAMLSVASQG